MDKSKRSAKSSRSIDGLSTTRSSNLRPNGSSIEPHRSRPTPATSTAPKLSASELSNYMRRGSAVKARQHPTGVNNANKQRPQAVRPSSGQVAEKQSNPRQNNSSRQNERFTVAPTYRSNTVNEDRRTSRRRSKRTHKYPRLRRSLLLSAGMIGGLLLITGGWMAWKVLSNSNKIFGGNVLGNISGLINGVPLKGQETGRVNILLAGNSADDAGHDGADLTDSIMLISIDTNNNQAFMLSIPRDFWVNIPGVGYRKINEANYWGNQNSFHENGYPKGGMGLLEKTLESTLGLNVNYYALIDYSAFKDAVNTVGGVSVDVQSDDPRGLYDPTFRAWEGGPLKLSNGPHKLSGSQALKLARARGHDGGYGYSASDFTRTENQRKMLIALKDKTLSAGVVSNPIKLGHLLDSVGDNVKTDFKLNEINSLIDLGNKIKKIDSLSFEDKQIKLLDNYTTPTRQSALIPAAGLGQYDDIIDFLRRHMSADPLVRENALVSILNGTMVEGLAGRQRTTLLTKNIKIGLIDTAAKQHKQTVVITAKNVNKPSTRALLSQTYDGIKFIDQTNQSLPPNTDFQIILGKDFSANQTNKDNN